MQRSFISSKFNTGHFFFPEISSEAKETSEEDIFILSPIVFVEEFIVRKNARRD
jgi:hypothetical protein